MPKNLSNFFINCLTNVVDERGDSSQNKYETYSIAQTEDGKLEKKTEVEVIASPKPVAQDVLVKQENTEENVEREKE